MQFGERLKQTRLNKNLTQEQVAEKLFITRQTISSWENEKSYPDINSLIKLSDFYQVSLDTLIKEDSGMKEYLEKNEVTKSVKPVTRALLTTSILFVTLMILTQSAIIKLGHTGGLILFIFGILNIIAMINLSKFIMKVDPSKRPKYFKINKPKDILSGLFLIILGIPITIYLSENIGSLIFGVGGAIILIYLINRSIK